MLRYKETGTLTHSTVHPVSQGSVQCRDEDQRGAPEGRKPSGRARPLLSVAQEAPPSCPHPRPEKTGLCPKSHSKPGAALWPHQAPCRLGHVLLSPEPRVPCVETPQAPGPRHGRPFHTVHPSSAMYSLRAQGSIFLSSVHWKGPTSHQLTAGVFFRFFFFSSGFRGLRIRGF